MNPGFIKFFNYFGLLVIMALFIFIFISASFNIPKIEINENTIHKPGEDLSFIKRFVCISDLFGEEQWTKEKGRTFTEDGILLTNGKKHPVNLCHYALWCYDEYRATGIGKFKESFLINARCLLDSNYYHVIDDDKIAYPYTITFHDLRPPWYSALAQSEAISVLVRYYEMTGDTSALSIIIKAKNFMIAPSEFSCGTKSLTPEGHEWYEEYPNSKQEKQVLNGFLLSIVALYEFSKLFPNDTETFRLYENSIKTVKATFPHYDTGSWLRYNRGDKRVVSNGYMKWQILELKLLHQLTGDIYFKHLMMLVSTYAYNKPYSAPGSKLVDYDFSVPLTQNNSGPLTFAGKRRAIDFVNDVNQNYSNSGCKINKSDLNKLSDTNLNTFADLCLTDSVRREYTLGLKFKKNQKLASLVITYAGFDSLPKPELQIFYKDSSNNIAAIKEVKITDTIFGVKSAEYYFQTINCYELLIKIKKSSNEKGLKIAELIIARPLEKVDFDFCHFITPIYESKSNSSIFNFVSKNTKNLVIFSKSSNSIDAIDKEKWDPLRVKTGIPIKLEHTGKKYYRFMIVAEPKTHDVEIKNLNFKNVF